MLLEGTGKKAPKPIVTEISAGLRRLLRHHAQVRNGFRDYANRSDAWGRGFIREPVYHSLVAEHALIAWLNRSMGLALKLDTSLRLGGDGGRDLVVFGLSIQVKTQVKGTENLIRRMTGDKRVLRLICDVFVFTRDDDKALRCDLLGWIRSEDAQRVGRFQPSRVADHYNLAINHSDLIPMAHLLELLQYRRSR